MKIDNNASIENLDPSMRPVLAMANKIWALLGQELVVTCGVNGTHSAGSLHYYGCAVDLRTRYFDDKGSKAAAMLKDALKEFNRQVQETIYIGSPEQAGTYAVVIESSHIHVQFKPHLMEVEQALYTEALNTIKFKHGANKGS